MPNTPALIHCLAKVQTAHLESRIAKYTSNALEFRCQSIQYSSIVWGALCDISRIHIEQLCDIIVGRVREVNTLEIFSQVSFGAERIERLVSVDMMSESSSLRDVETWQGENSEASQYRIHENKLDLTYVPSSSQSPVSED